MSATQRTFGPCFADLLRRSGTARAVKQGADNPTGTGGEPRDPPPIAWHLSTSTSNKLAATIDDLIQSNS